MFICRPSVNMALFAGLVIGSFYALTAHTNPESFYDITHTTTVIATDINLEDFAMHTPSLAKNERTVIDTPAVLEQVATKFGETLNHVSLDGNTYYPPEFLVYVDKPRHHVQIAPVNRVLGFRPSNHQHTLYMQMHMGTCINQKWGLKGSLALEKYKHLDPSDRFIVYTTDKDGELYHLYSNCILNQFFYTTLHHFRPQINTNGTLLLAVWTTVFVLYALSGIYTLHGWINKDDEKYITIKSFLVDTTKSFLHAIENRVFGLLRFQGQPDGQCPECLEFHGLYPPQEDIRSESSDEESIAPDNDQDSGNDADSESDNPDEFHDPLPSKEQYNEPAPSPPPDYTIINTPDES